MAGQLILHFAHKARNSNSATNFIISCFVHVKMQSEINFLGRISHPNLVKLLGYCKDNNKFLLVYEFMPRGNLETHLFRSKYEL